MRLFKFAGRAPWILRTVALSSTLFFGGCGGDEGQRSDDANDSTTPDDSNTPGDPSSDPGTAPPSDGGAADPPGQDEPPPPPCDDAQAAVLQKSFDDAAPTNVDAVAFVKDLSCGERFFTRGPSKYPVTTAHMIASNSKTYIASLILTMVNDGLLKLDDPIATWIEKVPGGNAITVRQVLNHTSGIYNFTDDTEFQFEATFKKKKIPPDNLIKMAFKKDTYSAPGKEMHYSNTNYVILGRIAEKVGGKPVETLLRERVLTPIGAKNTAFFPQESLSANVAVGKKKFDWDSSIWWCSGNIAATPDDLANWIEKLATGSFHSKEMNKELLTTVPYGKWEYGLGIIVFDAGSTHGGGTAIGHLGDIWGFHSLAMYFPEKKTTVVVVVDSDDGPSGGFPGATYRSPLANAILDPLFGGTPPAP